MPTRVPMNDHLRSILRRRLGDLVQIVGDHAPADPTLHPIVAMIATAVQTVAPFQATYPPFDPCPPVPATPEPPLPFVCQTRRRLRARFGQHHLLDPVFLCIPFAPRRVGAAIPGQQVRRLVEAGQVMIDTRHHLPCFLRIALQHGIAADHPAVQLGEPDQPAKRGVARPFVFADNGSMRLEQADDLLACAKLLTVQHPTGRLIDHLRDAGEQLRERCGQFLGRAARLIAQGAPHLLRLLHDLSISHLAWELDIAQNMRHAGRFRDRAHWMNHMKQDIAINSLLTETATQANTILGVEVTATTILVRLQPTLAPAYQRPDCQQPVVAAYHDSELLTVQGLGVPGKAVRYQVKRIRLGYLNDAGTFTTFTVPIPGIRTDLLVTDEVVEQALYLHVDRNLSLAVTAAMLRDLYQIETSTSALDRWKAAEAQALPAIGTLIQYLNQKN